nr:immunoglobulin light chain junction region [Macaca mulatta]
TMQGLEFPLTF